MAEILIYPDDTLRQVSSALPPIWWQDDAILKGMKAALEAMRHARGAGISGIQIGVPLRFFWMMDERGEVELVANPRPQTIELKNVLSRPVREGCLSFPNVWASVRRRNSILATYERSDSSLSNPKTVSVELTGLKAHVFQHELEHLDGKLFIDHLFPSEREAALRKMAKPLS